MPTITDHRTAESIIDNLGYHLQDLSIDYGDVVIPDGDISHQLFLGNTLQGYVWVDGDIYYTSFGTGNYRTADQAALELIPQSELDRAYLAIKERDLVAGYF